MTMEELRDEIEMFSEDDVRAEVSAEKKREIAELTRKIAREKISWIDEEDEEADRDEYDEIIHDAYLEALY